LFKATMWKISLCSRHPRQHRYRMLSTTP